MAGQLNRRWVAILFVLFVCVPAYSQRTGRTGAQARAQKEAQEREQRRRDEEAIQAMPDAGSDLAFVVALESAILQEPSAKGAALQPVKRGEVLTLIEREPQGTWYKVIHVESAIEGWIEERAVVIKLTANPENAPPLDKEATGTEADPELEVSNLEKSTDLNVRINGTLYVIRADTTKTITLKPGKYRYYAWSPGIRAAIGSDDLRKGYKYSWTFQIVRH